MQHLSIEKLKELSDKWLKGTIATAELELLEAWYDQEPQDNIEWEAGDNDEEQLKERLFYNINEAKKADTSVRKLISMPILYRIAAILIAILGGVFCYSVIISPKAVYIAGNNKVHSQVRPNTNKAVLTLANGSTMILDNADNGLIAKQGNTKINKAKDGQLIYNNETARAEDVKVQTNMISTLSGGQYQVLLPDGSKVWLNALTSLKFPTVFKGSERVVELTGEAYFEVAKNKDIPFKVKLANNTTIVVLGTHFNIMAYANENSIDATLLEGSINVEKGKLNKLMIPGQEANITDEIKLTEVNPEEAVSWKNGLFSFDNADIHTVMRQIERWYNVDVIYEGKVSNNQITGYISRSSNISEVLKMLELSGLRTTIEGDKIKVFNN